MSIYSRIFFALFILAIGRVHAQAPSFTAYKRLITQSDGLPDRNLLCGIQDKYGFLWLGTRSGLCRYDGNHFIFFTPKSHGLRGTAIFSLAADDSTGIIITYAKPGSSVIADRIRDVVDIKTLEVKPMSSYYPSIPFKESAISNIFYTAGRPLEFFPDSTSYCWTYLHATGFQQKKIQGKPIRALLPGLEKRGKAFIQQINDQLSRDIILRDDSTLITLNRNYLTLICPGKGYLVQYNNLIKPTQSSLYFLNYQGELLPLDSAGTREEGFKNYNVYRWCTNYFYNLHSIHPAGNQQATVMELTDNSVVFYSAGTGFIPLFQKGKSIHVSSFFKDRQGAYWLCTSTGLYKVVVKKKRFKQHFTRASQPFAFNNSVRGIYADDNLLAASLYDVTVIKHHGQDIQILPGDQNFAILRMNNTLWLGGRKLGKYDIPTRKRLFTIETDIAEIWSMFPINSHQLLLGGTRCMAVYDLKTNHVTDVADHSFPQAKFTYRIFRNSRRQLMAVAENGLYVLSDSGTVIDCYYKAAPSKDRQLPCSSVYDVYEDREGIYWIASNLEGLFRWDRHNNSFRQYGIEDGLLSTIIYTIQEDDYNNLWLGTDYGLARLNKKTGIVTNYTMQDGISDNEFNRSSSFKDHKGTLYFGGMNGITAFNPADFVKDPVPQNFPFVLTGFQRFDVKTGAQEDVTAEVVASKKIELQESRRLFTLSYSLLDYDNREHRYAYKVEGLDKDWNYINEDHIRLSNLPNGKYKLRIKAQLTDGNWNEQEIAIDLVIIPPFYKTWWFIITSILGGILLIILVFKIRMRMLRAKNENLEILVNERTGALNMAMNEQKAMLQEIHHRVKNNLQFIQAMIAMQINASKNESDQRVLMDTTRRINAMTLVHEMLYNRDHLESISIKNYIIELVDKLHNMVTDRQTPVQVEMAVEDVYLNINTCLALGMITSELFSNAVKHAFHQTSAPVIMLNLVWNADKNKIMYTIRDNGNGFDESRLETGLGMRLIDIFSRQLKGTYSMKNQGGFLFTFTFQWLAG